MCFSLFIVVSRALNTFPECTVSNACNTVGYGDGCQSVTPKECIVSDASHGVGDNRVFTSDDQFVIGSLDNRIAVVA